MIKVRDFPLSSAWTTREAFSTEAANFVLSIGSHP